MTWSANNLYVGYPKVIVGYDLRVAGDLHFPSTLSASVWPQHESMAGFDFPNYGNGLNLSVSDKPLVLLGALNDAQLVAFDFPVGIADVLAPMFGLKPISSEAVSASTQWGFLGYDVIDPRTQSSALYDFSQIGLGVTGAFGDLPDRVNKFGLINDEAAAIKASIFFDSKLPEHAPFSPCGIWRRTKAAGK